VNISASVGPVPEPSFSTLTKLFKHYPHNSHLLLGGVV